MRWLFWWWPTAAAQDVFEEIRRSLSGGEAMLQQEEWALASAAYESALDLMRENSLWINVAAESQLYNNVGWAAYQLGDYDRALDRFAAGARSCDRALEEGFVECVDKVYENLHELVHKTLGRRREALGWLRRGVALAAAKGGPDAALAARVRLGFLLVLEDELEAAEQVLEPLSSSHEQQALLQEAALYLGWGRALRRDWPGASAAFARSARLALPRNDSCQWRVQEGWLEGDTVVWPLAIWFDDEEARVRLVEINDVHVSGEDGTVFWKPAPACVMYSGEHTIAGSLPTDWGVEAVTAGTGDETLVTHPTAERRGAAVVLLDSRQGHKMFWHHQTETVTRLCVVVSRLYDRDGTPALDLPADVRRALDAATILVPPTLAPTVSALVARGHRTLGLFNRTRRIEAYEWRPGRILRFDTAFFVDWPPAEPRPNFERRSGVRYYSDSVFKLHFVPPALLRLQAAILRRAFPPLDDQPDTVLFYSRADADKRHVVSEDALFAKLRDRFQPSLRVTAWRGGLKPDIERAARDWSRAALVVGPHGAGLANFLHCRPNTPVLVLPAADARGAPSASDAYFIHLALALRLRIDFAPLDNPPPFFFNYSAFDDAQLDAIVAAAEALLHASPDRPSGRGAPRPPLHN